MELRLLPAGSPRLRVGFISDIHLGPTTPRKLLDRAFALLAAANLDVLLLGGDYVSLEATAEKAQLLARLVAGVPARRKLAVLGNHDLWSRHELLEEALRGVGVDVLCNEARTFDAPHENVALIGLDDPWTGTLDVERAFRGVGDPAAIVILCHSPEGAPAAMEALKRLPHLPPTLFVCGHTHGGQIAAPWGPVIVPGRFGKQFPHGLHTVGPLRLYVSRGVGGVELPIRTFARPEVAVFDLVPVSPTQAP
jgi:predicted MPP superfamily phosphohydrolase